MGLSTGELESGKWEMIIKISPPLISLSVPVADNPWLNFVFDVSGFLPAQERRVKKRDQTKGTTLLSFRVIPWFPWLDLALMLLGNPTSGFLSSGGLKVTI
jgi:hypothetical protein